MSEQEVVQTPEEKLKIINGVIASLGSPFSYEPIAELDEVRNLTPPLPEAAFESFLQTRHGRILCADCTKAARYWERMKLDSRYKRPVCTVCMEKYAQKFYERRITRSQRIDPNAGRYKITSAQAQAIMKGKHG